MPRDSLKDSDPDLHEHSSYCIWILISPVFLLQGWPKEEHKKPKARCFGPLLYKEMQT